MKYKSVVVTRLGDPEVLRVLDNELRPPSAREVRIRILAAAVCRPDVTARRGEAFYSGTPLGQKPPFVPGYAIIGVVDAIGNKVVEVRVGDRVGALTVLGGYSEYLYWRSDRLISVPVSVDPAEAVTLVLNYIVAYQVLHRSARVKSGDSALIIGASGGIGTALMQLGRLAGLKMYGIASRKKHAILRDNGVTPIDYRTQDFTEVIRHSEPEGVDAVFNGMMSLDYIRRSVSVLKPKGKLVCYGEPRDLRVFMRILWNLLKVNLLTNRGSFKLYGTSPYFLGYRRPFIEDWTILFRLLEEGKIKPVITKRYPILSAARANSLLECGQVAGNVVLLSPELL
jgi:NADPH:quinone reductase-like Zn-dependent oxidoreductase